MGNIKKSLIDQKKLQEKEDWHKLVVKVIVWKDGPVGSGFVQFMDKITPKEWKDYRKRLTRVNAGKGKEKIQALLKEKWERINENGGFA